MPSSVESPTLAVDLPDPGPYRVDTTHIVYYCVGDQMADQRPNRFNVLLDDEHAAKLYSIADRTYVNAGTLARSLLSTALDQADPAPENVTALLDSIPGAYESAVEGRRALRAGRVVRLEDF
jgi:hypothetical protein